MEGLIFGILRYIIKLLTNHILTIVALRGMDLITA